MANKKNLLTRRDLMKMGVLASGGFALLPPGGGIGRVSSFFTSNQGRSPRLTPFVDPFPTFDVLTKVRQFDPADIAPYASPYFGVDTPARIGTQCFEIDAVERNVKFHRDLPPTSAWAYVDKNRPPASDRLITFQFPKVTHGQPAGAGILVRHFNTLPTAPRDFGFPITTVHLHGTHSPAPADGFPTDIMNRPADFPAHVVIRPGDHHDYMYPFRDVGFSHGQPTKDDRTSTLWFHDHLLDFTGANVYRGLANIMPVFDDIDTGEETDAMPALGLPSGPFDLPLVLQDKIFD
ncbi:MAG TPA: hypothetical protein VNZ26_09925, partial [Vicinamibacterales bacterium]|nr:hypothetical protein [Vicinamibacterales bacterium]